jgi:hypothetical protein
MTTMSHAVIDTAASCERPTTLRTVRAPTPVRPRTEPPSSLAASASGMIFVVSEPEVAPTTVAPVIGATPVTAALWLMFAVAVAETIAF